jgi:AraC-like DNA-binding protein
MQDNAKFKSLERAKLLMYGHSLNTCPAKDRWHEHSCWQAELPEQGQAVMLFADKSIPLSPGKILLIPPGVRHSFEYGHEKFATWSLRFAYKIPLLSTTPLVTSRTQAVEQCAALIETTLQNISSDTGQTAIMRPPPDQPEIIFIESALSALADYAYHEKNYTETDSLTANVRTLIRERRGTPLTVEEAADILGYSRSHLSLLFRQRHGIPLKTFIDRERVEIAKQFLDYTDMNVSETAETMGFQDVYYFSNFFKRLTGLSPLNYQKSRRTSAPDH